MGEFRGQPTYSCRELSMAFPDIVSPDIVWHYVFGFANRRLVEAGLFTDPCAPTRKYKRDIPAAFENDAL